MDFKGSMDTYGLAGQKAESPAAERNKQVIFETLQQHLPEAPGLILEVASGSGQHVAHFATQLPAWRFQPTDVTSELFGSIAAWCAGLDNVAQPKLLDAAHASSWQGVTASASGPVSAVVCINMCHISPWSATVGLIQGASGCLGSGGLLFIYGPFKRDGAHTSESNAAFDATLHARDPEWGYRDTADIVTLAEAAGLKTTAIIPMPANNFSLVFNKQ